MTLKQNRKPLMMLGALCLFSLTAQPLCANQTSLAYFTESQAASLPKLMSNEESLYYASFFEAIETRNWERVEQLIVERPSGPLHGAALAKYYLHPSSPQIPLDRLDRWLQLYRDLPQAEAIIRLAERRGLTDPPNLRPTKNLVRQPGITRRMKPRSINDGTMPSSIEAAIRQRITNDDPDGARLLLDGIDASLSPYARSEWRQRVAWSYYIENRDREALALAQTVAAGAGPWVAEGDWIVGLAAWRLGDCRKAANGFRSTAAATNDIELSAAAHYWGARALIRCREPELAMIELRIASGFDETLYGMLAAEQLGTDLPPDHTKPDFTANDWQEIADEGAARQAVMLNRLGQRDEAGQSIRHLVRTGDSRDYPALGRLARALALPGTQNTLAYNAPSGFAPDPALRWPVTYQTPRGGWRVDPALAFAHALQESNFRETVVSPAGAIGLMQIMPITRREYAASLNLSPRSANLKDPAINLAFGQRTLEALAQSPATQGRLPKIMAAYNAGLTPVTRWNTEVRDGGDPLTWMESLPYWETRGYVNIVMRNYWMYLRQADAPAESRRALAENRWPGFPQTRR